MKVLFYYKEAEQIGIEYLLAILKKAGHETDLIFDCGSSNKFGMVKSSIFTKTQNIKRMVEKAKKFNPDLIAFSSETDIYPDVKKIAYILKKELNVPTIIGGRQATNLPEYVLKEDCFDMLCRGEGEEAILELVDKLEKGKDITKIKNLWVKKNGKIYKNTLRPLLQDLDKLPFPDKDLFYKYGAFSSQLIVMGSRGCPYSCSYCNNSYYMQLYKGKGKYVRRRSVMNIIDEIKHFKQKFPIKVVDFEDENFMIDKTWLKEFCEVYKKEINLPFWCEGSPREIDEEKISWLRKAGCKLIFMGIESGNYRVRKEIFNRPITDEKIIKAAGIIKKAKIKLEATAIFGSPTETPEEMWDTVKLFEKVKPDAINTYTLYPYANTKAFDISKEKGYLSEEAIKQIYEGKEGSHGHSILNHSYKDLAYNLSKLLPLYVRLPKFLKPQLKKLMKNKPKKYVDYFYMALLPLDYPYLAKEMLKLSFKNFFRKY